MSDSISSNVHAWLTIFVAIATIFAAYFAARSARFANDQAKAAIKAVEEAKKQGALNKAQLKEMQRQSDISLHEHRLNIYKAFLEFRFELKAKASGFKREKLWTYWAQARLAEFYFSSEITSGLISSVDRGDRLKTLAGRISDPQGASQEEVKCWREESSHVYLELDGMLNTLDEDIRKVIRLVAHGAT